ncbi:ubiquinol-cytochrome c reductase cytochrome b subunit [Nocardioidaceae bacterium SCSIO 66511]|nr:ubiquinol-cytochrome c reductase cytochrome b subunit [Nocardioidaceae bacterium SCSIO 66511]
MSATTEGSDRIQDTGVGKKAAGPVQWLDDRLGLAGVAKGQLRKIFPDHWSFMLGEIALWSFVVLLLSGVFLTLWFDPTMTETVYHGSYAPLRGIEMSAAYESTLHISFDIRGGLLMRQIHHWAAALFVAAMIVHMLRVFFTGAYRRPRELNWLIGIGLLSLGLVEGFAGYSLPDDLLSGTGLRFVDGLIRSIPIVGSYLEFFIFGGEFPGDVLIPRLYMVHILLVPALLLGLIGAHMLLLVYHKHTQWPGAGKTEKNVVGYPLLPVYAAKAGGFFFIVFGATALMGALFQINPVWNYGPYDPSQVTAGSQPDWYMGWVEGAVRIMPNWESTIFGWTFSWNVFLPAVLLMGLLFTVLALYPFVEQWVTGDKREHHLLERPRNNPTRTALGVAGMTCYGVFWIAGGNDIIAVVFHLDIFAITWFCRIMVFVGPVIAFLVTKRICIGLQRQDVERVLHGYETGIIERSPDGAYSERHAPLDPEHVYELTAHNRPQVRELPEDVDENGVHAPNSRIEKVRARLSRFFHGSDIAKPTREELEEANEHHGAHGEIEPVDDEFGGVSETGIPRQH